MTIGFVLIIIVLVLTFGRSYFFPSKSNNQDNSDQAASNNTPVASKKITLEDLANKIKNKEDIKIIDLRDPDVFQAAHIADSQNISLSDLPNSIDSLDKKQTYVFVDQLEDPTVVDLVSNILPASGFENVSYLEGGLSAWTSEQYAVVNIGDPYSVADQSKVNYINTDELKKDIEDGRNLYLIDLRKSDAFADGHIKNSVNIYLGDLEARRKEIPMGKKIVLLDADGLWAFMGAVKLFDTSVYNVFALSDGLDSWKTKGYEIVK